MVHEICDELLLRLGRVVHFTGPLSYGTSEVEGEFGGQLSLGAVCDRHRTKRKESLSGRVSAAGVSLGYGLVSGHDEDGRAGNKIVRGEVRGYYQLFS